MALWTNSSQRSRASSLSVEKASCSAFNSSDPGDIVCNFTNYGGPVSVSVPASSGVASYSEVLAATVAASSSLS